MSLDWGSFGDPRIVGGYEVNPPFRYPVVALYRDGGSYYCMGTLYKDDTVITAGHCGSDVGTASVKVHRHDMNKTEAEENGKTYKVVKMNFHPDHDGRTRENDIAVWKLVVPTSVRSNVELDNGTYGNQTGLVLTAVGWGTTQQGGKASKKLLEVKLPIYDPAKCVEDLAKKKLVVLPRAHVCAGYPEGGKDTCQGDSGGPLFLEKGGKLILVGVTSFGWGCAHKDSPGGYTRVSWVKDWILGKV